MSHPPPERLHALDAVRGFALMLGVAFHATMSFMPGPSVWPVADSERTPVLSGAFFVLHIFRMTTFFLIAGFFARLMVERRGEKVFVLDRLKRIALPLVVGWPFLIAAIGAASLLAVVVANGWSLPPVIPEPAATPPVRGAFPLTHLWFLYVLLWLYAGGLLARIASAFLDRSGRAMQTIDRIVAVVIASPLSPIVLAVPFLVALWFAPVWMRWFGVPTADSNLIVNLQALAAFGSAFGLGWLLNRQVALARVWERRWPLNLALFAVLCAACLSMAGPTPELTPAPRTAQTYVFAVCYALAIWTGTFAAIGLALRFLSGHSPVRRYIADASYWVYLVHLPIIMALQALVSRLDWPWFVKFPAILAVGLPIMFLSYHWLVRYSLLGAILNGRRQVRPPPKPAILAAQES